MLEVDDAPESCKQQLRCAMGGKSSSGDVV
jgi:hypothetical protein